ncbi:MAG: ATPase [Desulfobacteraceae bacterium]|nr:MAG: ATPase [Desulfobacteraceae bacterium]
MLSLLQNKPLARFLNMHPASMIAYGFVGVILAGAGILMHPASTRSGHIHFIDALFTSASAVCVTGLTVVDTGGYFTIFGQSVILFLIQIGGLGVMTVSVMLFKLVGKNIPFRHRMALQDVFAHTPREDIFQVVKTIFIFTGAVEALGAIVLFVRWQHQMPMGQALYQAVFHSVSAFCNAGFSLFSDSLMKASGDWTVNGVVCLLIVLGGIGFPVVHDIYYRFETRRIKRSKLAVQTKAVLVTTAVLIVVGAVFFWVLEFGNAMAGRPFSESIVISVFQSVTCRTAGFNTIDIGSLHDATLLLMIFLMFFGASPGSCGGGVKTTTLALIVSFTVSRIRRKKRVNLFKKSIPVETVSRSISLILVCATLIGVVLFMLTAGNALQNDFTGCPERRFLGYLFEAVSAFGTVGLSMGLTSTLSIWGKIWIILLMLVGRVGILTFAYIVVGGGRGACGIEYAEENIMIG